MVSEKAGDADGGRHSPPLAYIDNHAPEHHLASRLHRTCSCLDVPVYSACAEWHDGQVYAQDKAQEWKEALRGAQEAERVRGLSLHGLRGERE